MKNTEEYLAKLAENILKAHLRFGESVIASSDVLADKVILTAKTDLGEGEPWGPPTKEQEEAYRNDVRAGYSRVTAMYFSPMEDDDIIPWIEERGLIEKYGMAVALSAGLERRLLGNRIVHFVDGLVDMFTRAFVDERHIDSGDWPEVLKWVIRTTMGHERRHMTQFAFLSIDHDPWAFLSIGAESGLSPFEAREIDAEEWAGSYIENWFGDRAGDP